MKNEAGHTTQTEQLKQGILTEMGKRYGSTAAADIAAMAVTPVVVAVFNRLVGEKRRDKLIESIAEKIVMPWLDKGEVLAEALMEKGSKLQRKNITLEERDGDLQQTPKERMLEWKSMTREERALKVADVILDVGITLLPALTTRIGTQYYLDKKWKLDNPEASPTGLKGIARVGWMQIPDKAASAVSMVGIHMYSPKLEKSSINFFTKLFEMAGQGKASAKANGALAYAHIVNTITGNLANAGIMTALNRRDIERYNARFSEASNTRSH